MKNLPYHLKLLILKVAVAVLVLVGGAVFAVARVKAADEWPVARRTVQDLKAVMATVESVDMVAARSRIEGVLSELLIDEGSQVEAGQPLARVIDAKLKLRMDALEARGTSLESERHLAETALARARELKASGTIPQARLDEAQSKFEVTTRNLAALRAERKVIEEQKDEGAILAPAPGRVIRVPVSRNSVVMPGETVATIAANTYILRVQLPERHARFVKMGDTVLVGERGLGATAADGGEPRKSGLVRQVYPEIRQGRVVADVTVPDLGDFFVGERVQVFVSAGEREAILVPPAYVFQRYGVSFVRLKDGREAVVQPGRMLDGGLEILSGLKDGDVLAAGTR
ncbi:MAG: efflux RND transporter periplasmic adaptor subunit [Magnetospirillum sp. WYHS-4]